MADETKVVVCTDRNTQVGDTVECIATSDMGCMGVIGERYTVTAVRPEALDFAEERGCAPYRFKHVTPRHVTATEAAPQGELAQIVAQLERINADVPSGSEDAIFVVVTRKRSFLCDCDNEAFDNVCDDAVECEHADVLAVLADMLPRVPLSAADLQKQIMELDSAELTPDYLRRMAYRIEVAGGA